jgi:TetR/AcrR family transcriptional repressor of nem operon
MARPKTFDEDTALDAAAQLFWGQGYDATSICDLEAAMGIGRQSIYNAFGDKREIFLKALDHYVAANKDRVTNGLLAPGAGLEAIRVHLREMVDFLAGPGPRRGCLVANSILELGTGDQAIARRCKASQGSVLSGFEHALSNAVAAGDLPPDLDVSATARMLMAQTYGMAVLSKSGTSRAALSAGAEELLDRLG